MPSPSPVPPTRPTLEDLLRFKRSERPSPEFWTEFEKGLRAKQLSALMQRPKSRFTFRPAVIKGLCWTAPAAAALAVAFIVVRGPAPFPSAPSIAALAAEPSEQATPLAPAAAASGTRAHAELHSGSFSAAAMLASANTGTSDQASFPSTGDSGETTGSFDSSLVSVDFAPADELQPAAFTARVQLASMRSTPGEQNHSSWSQPVVEAVPVTGWGETDPRLLQLTALDLRVSAAHADNLLTNPTGRPLPPAARWARSTDDRDFRDLAGRIGVTGSSLSIKF